MVSFDLSHNEVHLDPLPEVREILASSADTLNRYPRNDGVTGLMERIAALHGLGRDHVVVGPGSVGVLDAVLHAHSPAKASTVFGTPTFDEYSALISRAGGVAVAAASDPPGRQSLDDMLSRVDASTRQVIVATPHNPTGAAVSFDEIAGLRAALPDCVLLIVDQAYAEFDETMAPDALHRLVTELPAVVVLRSFSKAYGLAGLRIGYGVFSAPELAATVRSALPTYAVNSFALTAAQESLRHQHRLHERVSHVIENRRRLEAFLRTHGLFCGVASQGNFVWLPAAESHALFQHARSDGILLREYPGLGVRITVQSDDSVDAVLASLTAYLAADGSPDRGRTLDNLNA